MALVIRTKTTISNNDDGGDLQSRNHRRIDQKNFHDEKSNESIGDPIWELIDPNPNIHDLFLQFNDTYFQGRLAGCEIRWSPRMTSCAGLCIYEGWGGLCSIRLSEPLLKLRPRKNLIEMMLHEMIHAYLFVTENNKDREYHGPEFQRMMNHINLRTGLNITIYHNFDAEVAEYQKHWWRCDGPCQREAPFFGWVKRAMNRAPGPSEFWFDEHRTTCGGKFLKVKEPEDFKANKKSKNKNDSLHNSAAAKNHVISSSTTKSSTNVSKSGSTLKAQNSSPTKDQQQNTSSSSKTLDNYFSKLPGKCHSLFSAYIATTASMTSPSTQMTSSLASMTSSLVSMTSLSTPMTSSLSTSTSTPPPPHLFVADRIFVNCPVCDEIFDEKTINAHLDECIAMQ